MSLANFMQRTSHPTVWPFSPNENTATVLPEEVLQTVSNGVLQIFQSSLNNASKSCKLISSNPDCATVRETVKCRESRVKTVTKDVDWEVTWRNGVPSCSCNRLVYDGMPCMHIAQHAVERCKSIPLCCFHKRFYTPAKDFSDDVTPEQESPVAARNGDTESDTVGAHAHQDDDSSDCDGDDDDETEDESDEDDETEVDDGDTSRGKSDDDTDNGVVQEEVCACVITTDDSVHRISINTFLPVVLKSEEEILLYHDLQSAADRLVKCYHVNETEAEKVEKELSLLTKLLVSICNETCPQLKGKKVMLDTECADLDRVKPLSIVSSPETKGYEDDLHIASASLDSHFPSESMCAFRGKLLAKITLLLLANRINHPVAQGSIRVFLKSINDFVARCPVPSEMHTATVARVAGRLTRTSYKIVPQKIVRYCVDELIELSSDGVPYQLPDGTNVEDEQSSQSPPVKRQRRISRRRRSHKR